MSRAPTEITWGTPALPAAVTPPVSAAGTPTWTGQTVVGTSGDDMIESGPGHDRLIGGDGSDTYVFQWGHDTIDDKGTTGADTVRISGFNAGDASWDRAFDGSGTLVLRLENTNFERQAELRIENFLGAGATSTIASLEFDDGTIVTAAQIRADIEALLKDLTAKGYVKS